MYIYFEDWTAPGFLEMLDKAGTRHGNRIIKVYSSPIDPRKILGRSDIKIYEASDSTLSAEQFEYKNRGVFLGSDIENKISDLSELGIKMTRALFRFSNRPDLESCQTAMSLKRGQEWLINHPLGEIDSLDLARRHPILKTPTIHLDIFVPETLEKLGELVDTSPNSIEILPWKIGFEIKKYLIEGEQYNWNKERK